MSKKALADQMAYDRSYVSHIEGGTHLPTKGFTQRAEEVLDTGGVLWGRWDALQVEQASSGRTVSTRRSDRDLKTIEFVSWIAAHSDREFSAVYHDVANLSDRFDQEAASARHARSHAQANVTRAQLADSIINYYDLPDGQYHTYEATVGHEYVQLSVLTNSAWQDDPLSLRPPIERMGLHLSAPEPQIHLEGPTYQEAVARLAQTEIDGTVMVNNPIYRLLACNVDSKQLDATFAVSDFASFALTSDLMESELIEALSHGDASPSGNALPLRDTYLPTVKAALDPASRECAGGPAVLVAIARPANGRRPADYVLLIQERSGLVVNSAGKLAVIPKAFHQPAIELAREVDLSATIIREFEEELLGRQDLERLGPDSWRQVDALHHHHRSQPMAWLLDPDGEAFHMECTGFGYNMVAGTYEFACLIVIEDESWWAQWGHQVEANWEAQRIHRYSSLDTDGLAALAHDPRWSNEGLFSYLQGLQRLADFDNGSRVASPPIHVTENPQ